MSTLFNSIQEGHDPRNRVVFLCQDPQGFYVFKPATGFKTRHWKTQTTKALKECFARQVSCGHQFGFYNPGEKPAADENYDLEPAKVAPVNPVPPVKVEETIPGTSAGGDKISD